MKLLMDWRCRMFCIQRAGERFLRMITQSLPGSVLNSWPPEAKGSKRNILLPKDNFANLDWNILSIFKCFFWNRSLASDERSWQTWLRLFPRSRSLGLRGTRRAEEDVFLRGQGSMLACLPLPFQAVWCRLGFSGRQDRKWIQSSRRNRHAYSIQVSQ